MTKHQAVISWSSERYQLCIGTGIMFEKRSLMMSKKSATPCPAQSGQAIFEDDLVNVGRAWAVLSRFRETVIDVGKAGGFLKVQTTWGGSASIPIADITPSTAAVYTRLDLGIPGSEYTPIPEEKPPEEKPPEEKPPEEMPELGLPQYPDNPFDVIAWMKWIGLSLAAIIKYLVMNIWTGISPVLKPLIDYLWSQLPPWIQEDLGTFLDYLKDPWTFMGSWLRPAVEATGGKISTASPEKWDSDLKPRPKYDSSVSWPWGGLVEAMRATIGDFEESANRTIAASESAQSTYPTEVPGSRRVELKPIAHSPEAEVPGWKTKSDTLQKEYAARILETAFKPMDDLMARSSPVTPDVALSVAGSVTAAATMITLAGVISGVAAEAASIGQIEEIGKGAREFIKLTGVTRLARDFVTAPISMGVKPWVSRYYDQLFRTHIFSRDEIDEFYIKDPNLESLWKQHYAWYGYPESYIEQFKKYLRHWPSERLLDQMLYHKQITPETWGSLYRSKGWKLEAIEAWSKTHWKYPGERLLSRILDVVPEEEPQIRIWLEETGYDEADVDKMISVFYKLAYKDEVFKAISQAITDFVDGWSSPTELETSIEDLGRPAKEVEYQVAVAKLRELKERKKLKLKILQGKVKRGEISLEVFESSITELGLQPDRVDLEVESIVLEQPELKVRELTVAEVRKLFRENRATEEITITRLLGRNVPAEDAALMIEDDWMTILRDERSSLITAALEDLDIGRTTPETCRSRLLDLQLRPEEADLKIARQLQDHERKYIKELIEIYSKDFREDVMNEEQFKASLVGLKLTEARIAEILFTEKERKVPAEARGG